MDELSTLQSRVDALLAIPITQPPAQAAAAIAPPVATGGVVAASRQRFSPFDPSQIRRATELARSFAALADSKEGAAGLSAALDEADKAIATEDPDLVRYALKLFMTHHPKGNQLKLKPLEKRAPQLVLPSRPAEAAFLATGAAPEVPSETSLNWFREDPMANEHHEHWHLVYLSQGDLTGHTKNRQGELFLYMHEQMIARYDAERLAVGLQPVKPFPMSDYREQIPEGYNPDPHLREGGVPFSSRLPGERMQDFPGLSIATLKQWGDNLLQAAQDGTFQDANQLGAAIEASIDSIDQNTYGDHHNLGHGFLAAIRAPQDPGNERGVMSQTITAIRDPIFFRWHKHVDDISYQWQEHQAPNDFSDAPQVQIRKGLNGATPEHQSPDIILCFKDKVLTPGSDDSDASWQKYGETNFGGANWDKDFSSSDTTTGELQTTMRQRQIIIRFPEGDNKSEPISYLYPREFFYFLRVENLSNQSKDVTARIFLAPTGSYAGISEVSEDRRKWIEMDKFKYTLKPSERAVIFRRAERSSVIRKPAVKTFDLSADDDTDANCDCGWPYNLLLPRGTSQGMNFRLLAMITDGEKDQVPDETDLADPSCDAMSGSMSYCGAKDKYPDTRSMGYPFDRPFPAGQIVAQTIAGQKNMATRDIVIKLVDSVP
jgi:hemocyanin-like protein